MNKYMPKNYICRQISRKTQTMETDLRGHRKSE